MTPALRFLPLAFFAIVATAFAVGLTRDPAHMPSVLIEQPVPEFALSAIEAGRPGLTSDALRGQVSLLNVFGSWCVGCAVEHPVLMDIAASGAAPIYGVDWKDLPGRGAAWLARHGDPYTAVGDDHEGRLALDLGVTGAPETFVIDRQGVIRYKHVGPITPQIWREELAPLVEQLQGR